jgi:hypothetical protein
MRSLDPKQRGRDHTPAVHRTDTRAIRSNIDRAEQSFLLFSARLAMKDTSATKLAGYFHFMRELTTFQHL